VSLVGMREIKTGELSKVSESGSVPGGFPCL